MEFKDLIEARRSVRKYVASEISKAEVEAIVGEALPSFNVASTANAAALVAVTFRKGESGYMGTTAANELGEMWGAYDCGLASAYFILAAKNHGWDSLILGIRDAEKIKAIMGIPDDETLTAVIALGKVAGAAAKPLRKPVGEVVKVS